MRAILLVKDDEGLTDDRLKNGRYGLTNKPALTQQNIAGSLQASFKAGQNVTLGNLRSLNKKLQEAQKALDNANGNIDKSEETQDKIDDAVNEATDLLSSNIWERWWQGTLGKGREDSDKQLFALKYMEDEFNKLRAGEPGNPVISTGGIMSTAPLPRVAYWDPIFSIHSHKVKADDDVYFLTDQLAIQMLISDKSSDIMMKVTTVSIIVSAMTSLSWVALAAFRSEHYDHAVTNLIYEIETLAMLMALFAYIGSLMMAISNSKYKELAGTTGRAKFYRATAPSTFANSYWRLYVYIDPIINSTISSLITTIYSIAAYKTALTATIVLGSILSKSSWPPTAAIGKVMMNVANAMWQVVSKVYVFAKMAPLAVSTALYVIFISTSRNNDKSVIMAPTSLTEADKPPYKELSNTLWGQLGVLGQILDDLDVSGIDAAILQLAKIVSIATLIGPILSGALNQANKFAERVHSLTEFTSNESRVAIIEPEFEDWFGMTRPNFSWNYNLKDYGSINAGSFPGESWDVSGTMEIKARVYPGFVLDKNAASKVFQGKTITRSVVIRQKFTTKNGFIYYGYLLLGEVSGKLYLVYERNCVYNASYRATTVRHAEQLIVNSGIFEGEPTAYFTYDRRGQLNYMYVDFEDGVRAQYRALKSAKENWLDGELINTEYDWNPYTVLTRSPSNGNTEGYINSYGDQ